MSMLLVLSAHFHFEIRDTIISKALVLEIGTTYQGRHQGTPALIALILQARAGHQGGSGQGQGTPAMTP